MQKDYLILTVKATDNDTDENGKVYYHLQVNSFIIIFFLTK